MDWEGASPAIPSLPRSHRAPAGRCSSAVLGTGVCPEGGLPLGRGSTVGAISSSWGSETGFLEQGPLSQPWKRRRGSRQGEDGRERHAEQWEQHGQRLGTVKGVACGA